MKNKNLFFGLAFAVVMSSCFHAFLLENVLNSEIVICYVIAYSLGLGIIFGFLTHVFSIVGKEFGSAFCASMCAFLCAQSLQINDLGLFNEILLFVFLPLIGILWLTINKINDLVTLLLFVVVATIFYFELRFGSVKLSSAIGVGALVASVFFQKLKIKT